MRLRRLLEERDPLIGFPGVAKRLGRKATISASTFHAYCHGILRRSGRDFHVLPPEDVYVFLRQRIGKLGLERFIRPADLSRPYEARLCWRAYSRTMVSI